MSTAFIEFAGINQTRSVINNVKTEFDFNCPTWSSFDCPPVLTSYSSCPDLLWFSWTLQCVHHVSCLVSICIRQWPANQVKQYPSHLLLNSGCLSGPINVPWPLPLTASTQISFLIVSLLSLVALCWLHVGSPLQQISITFGQTSLAHYCSALLVCVLIKADRCTSFSIYFLNVLPRNGDAISSRDSIQSVLFPKRNLYRQHSWYSSAWPSIFFI